MRKVAEVTNSEVRLGEEEDRNADLCEKPAAVDSWQAAMMVKYHGGSVGYRTKEYVVGLCFAKQVEHMAGCLEEEQIGQIDRRAAASLQH